MSPTIPYGHQAIDDDDIAAVVAVLKGDWLTQGPAIELFEDALARRVEARHAVAFSSGTAALHAAAAAAGIGPGRTMITSPLSFVASASCALYVGASAQFVDIDPATLNLDLTAVPQQCDALVAVHFAGLPLNLAALGHRPDVIIEDAAHALGAQTPDGPVGNCARSDMCTFSFHPVKAVTTGEGGAVTTNSGELAARLRSFRNHGMTRRPERGAWCYDIDHLGFNYRMTDIQAALGASQLHKLERFLVTRQQLAARYRELLQHPGITLPPAPSAGFTHAYHLFAIRIPNRRRVFDRLREREIGVQVHYIPIYRHSLYRDTTDRRAYPATEAAYEQLLSLPIFPSLTVDQQDIVIGELLDAL